MAMQEFTKPEFLNGAELAVELEEAGVVIDTVSDYNPDCKVRVDEFGVLWLNIIADPNDQAAYVVAHHHGNTSVQ